jgi:hypothetical protein
MQWNPKVIEPFSHSEKDFRRTYFTTELLKRRDFITELIESTGEGYVKIRMELHDPLSGTKTEE